MASNSKFALRHRFYKFLKILYQRCALFCSFWHFPSCPLVTSGTVPQMYHLLLQFVKDMWPFYFTKLRLDLSWLHMYNVYLPQWTDTAGHTGLMTGAGQVKQVWLTSVNTSQTFPSWKSLHHIPTVFINLSWRAKFIWRKSTNIHIDSWSNN